MKKQLFLFISAFLEFIFLFLINLKKMKFDKSLIIKFSILLFIINIILCSETNKIKFQKKSEFANIDFDLKKTTIYKLGKNIYEFGKNKIIALKGLLQNNQEDNKEKNKSFKKKYKNKKLDLKKIDDKTLNNFGKKFCLKKCKAKNNNKKIKCQEGNVSLCNSCVSKRFYFNKNSKENKMCNELCNQKPNKNSCQFYPFKIKIKRKYFEEVTLNKFKKT